MPRTIFCKKLKTEAEGLDFAPIPGELGLMIYQNISKEAWQQWLEHQTILINEYWLNSLEVQAREFLSQEMKKFLFNEENQKE